MTTESHTLTVGDLEVEVVRKGVKNLHLGVYPPDGRVRVAAPQALSDDAVRLAVVMRLNWIRRQQAAFAGQERESPREMVSGESHYVFGRRLRLQVDPTDGREGVSLQGRDTLRLRVTPGSSPEARLEVLRRWYRAELRAVLAPLVEAWSAKLMVQPTGWRIQRMKTKWASCNTDTGRLLFNLELAKKPVDCVAYIVVHELAHLRFRRHDANFEAMMDQHLPNWRALRQVLNAGPLGHEEW